MKAQPIGAAAVIVGLLLVALSLVWPSLDDARSEWTDEDALVHQDLTARVHAGHYMTSAAERRTTKMHAGNPVDGAAIIEHRENVRRLDELNARLNAARERPYQIASLFKWSGAGIVAVGVAVLLARGKSI